MSKLKLLVLHVIFLTLNLANAFDWQSGNDGRVKWASNCDFKGGDIGSQSSKAEHCGGMCVSNGQCTHFTWFNGVCYLKKANFPTASNLDGGVCGWVEGPIGPPGGGPIIYKRWYSGDGTYYGMNDGTGGACTLTRNGQMPPAGSHSKIRYRVALNAAQFRNGAACGMCFRVRGSGVGSGTTPISGDFFVFVNNLCPECHEGSVDLAANGDGRWKVEIQAVQCPVDNTKLQYQFQGSNPWYMKLQVRNHRVPANRVELYQPGSGRWNALKMTADGYWMFDDSLPNEKPVQFPIRIRLTSVNGLVVNDSIQSLVNDQVLNGSGQQFPYDNNLPSA